MGNDPSTRESCLASPLVLGAGGRLGRAVEAYFSEIAPATVGATRAEIDIADYFRMCEEFERLRPTLVINCAALADVDRCENEPEAATRINAEGAGLVARACAAVGARLIHLSTDCVFGGGQSGAPHREDESPAPLSHYGASKWEGEKKVLREHPASIVVRTNWLFGPAGGDFVERTLRLAREEGWVGGVVDQIGSPTYTPDLAAALAALAGSTAQGVFHFTNSGGCTRHEFALRIVEMAGLAPRLEERAQRWADLRHPARRPANSVLSTERYTRITGRTPRPWTEALEEHLSRIGTLEP